MSVSPVGPRWRARVVALCVIAGAGSTACVPPKAPPITGTAPANATLPTYGLPPAHRRVTFKWEVEEGGMIARGEGVARIAPPDSARVDLFLAGGFGAASVTLIGDSLHTPPGASMTEMIPPGPLLWAALGRLALPVLPDTIIGMSGDTVRASIGHPAQWRVTAIAGELRRVERVAGNRIVESVDRTPGKRVRYQLTSRRSLVLDLTRDSTAAPFDASIWHY